MDPIVMATYAKYQHARNNMKPRDGDQIVSRQPITCESLDDSVPSMFQDVYHFSDLVYSIKNVHFNIPRSMTYGRYRYMIDSMTTLRQTPEIKALDFGTYCPQSREELISDMSHETVSPFDNLLILSVENSGESLINLPLTPTGSCHFVDEYHHISLRFGGALDLTIRYYRVDSFSSEEERISFLRLKLSESLDISPRVMFMLSDIVLPLEIIPGISDVSTLKDLVRGMGVLSRW